MLTAVVVLCSPAVAGVEFSLGAAAGAFAFQFDTNLEGWGAGVAGSPVLSVQLDPWEGSLRPVLGLTSAPTFEYSMGYDAYTRPLVVVDMGLRFGGATTHGSLAAHAGWWSFGASLRATHLPFTLGATARTGVEFRATWVSRWGGYASALWVVRLP